MRYLIILAIFELMIFANSASELFKLYQNKEYSRACDIGFNIASQNRDDEKFLSIYAFSCLNADQIDRLILPMALLTKSQESRNNASYFAMLLMQKKLLIQALYDDKKYENLNFPTSSHLISKIFDMYLKDSQPNNKTKIYIDKDDKRKSYKLYKATKNNQKTIAIDEYYDKIMTYHHIY